MFDEVNNEFTLILSIGVLQAYELFSMTSIFKNQLGIVI